MYSKLKNIPCYSLVILLMMLLVVSCSNSDDNIKDTSNSVDSNKVVIPDEVPDDPINYEIVQYEKLVEKDIVYKTVDDIDLKLDIYYPTNRIYYKNPTIVAFHGGSWVEGARSDIINSHTPLLDKLRENGYAIVSVQYRFVSDELYFPSNLEDCIDAILYLAENTDKYDVDSNAMGVMGYSAGAHLAMMSAYGMKTFSTSGKYIDLNYCISFAGPTKMYEDETSKYPKSILYMLEALFGASYEEKTDLYKLGSPYYYLNGDVKTPLMILQGNRDEIVPYSQSTLMFDHAAKMNVPCELITLENGTHAINFNNTNMPAREEIIDSIQQFIYKNTVKN